MFIVQIYIYYGRATPMRMLFFEFSSSNLKRTCACTSANQNALNLMTRLLRKKIKGPQSLNADKLEPLMPTRFPCLNKVRSGNAFAYIKDVLKSRI